MLARLAIKNIANCDVYQGEGIRTTWGRLYGGQAVTVRIVLDFLYCSCFVLTPFCVDCTVDTLSLLEIVAAFCTVAVLVSLLFVTLSILF